MRKLFLAGLVFVAAGSVLAQSETPKILPGGRVISVEGARKLADAKTAFFVDTQSVVNKA